MLFTELSTRICFHSSFWTFRMTPPFYYMALSQTQVAELSRTQTFASWHSCLWLPCSNRGHWASAPACWWDCCHLLIKGRGKGSCPLGRVFASWLFLLRPSPHCMWTAFTKQLGNVAHLLSMCKKAAKATALTKDLAASCMCWRWVYMTCDVKELIT